MLKKVLAVFFIFFILILRLGQWSPSTFLWQGGWLNPGIKTGEAFIFDSDLHDGFDKAASKTVWGDGDGLVNLLSLKQVEEVWPKDPQTSTKVFPNCTHFGMLSDPRVLTALAEYLARDDRDGSQNVTTLLV